MSKSGPSAIQGASNPNPAIPSLRFLNPPRSLAFSTGSVGDESSTLPTTSLLRAHLTLDQLRAQASYVLSLVLQAKATPCLTVVPIANTTHPITVDSLTFP